MRSDNSNLKPNDNKSPLISKDSPESKSYTPNKLFFDYENKLTTCKTNCSPVCNKTAYKDFIKFENEEKESKGSNNFSLNSLIIAFFTLFIFCFQIIYYRKTVNEFPIERFKNTHEFIREYSFFCWRIQSVCFFLVIFVYIAKYITKKYNSISDNNNTDDKPNHFFEIDWRNLISLNNLKFSLINSICYFIYYTSTKFLPIGVCLFLNSFGLFFDHIASRKNKKTLIKHVVFLLFGFVLLYYSLQRDFPELKYESVFNLQLISVFLYVAASILHVYTQRHYTDALFTYNSPLTLVIVIQINSLILTSFLQIIIEIFHYKSNIPDIFIWLLDWDSFVSIFVSFGLLGLLNSIVIIFSTVYLSTTILKAIKIIEIPFSEFLAIVIMELYSSPASFEYFFVIMNFTIYLAFAQFSKKGK
jgi:hypothetical protein